MRFRRPDRLASAEQRIGESVMGNITAAAYDVGVGLGLASYQASAGQQALDASAINSMKNSFQLLVSTHHISSNDFTNLFSENLIEANLIRAREQIEFDLRSNSALVANSYLLGLNDGYC